MIHTIKQGECILSISQEKGFFWKSIWEHGNNSKLRDLRKDPNVLAPGDRLFIPDKDVKNVNCSTEKKHSFCKKGFVGKIKIRLFLDDEPRCNENYELNVDGVTVKQGKTDANGCIEAPIPAGAQSGRIFIGDQNQTDIYDIHFGNVDPIDTDDGVKSRLYDLGYDVNSDFEGAVKDFQKKEGLEDTGQADNATRNKIKERFGQ